MSKKQNPTPELPAASEAQPSLHWPEKTETRCLRCDLNPTDRDKYGRESADIVQRIGQLEDDKKSSTKRYDAAIKENEARLSRISSYIRDGWEERQTKCKWLYECSGIDSTSGEPIYHPEKKALVRRDTNEVIEVTDISNEERQMALPIEEKPAEAEPGNEDDED